MRRLVLLCLMAMTALSAVLVAIFLLLNPTLDIRIDEERIQSVVDSRLPFDLQRTDVPLIEHALVQEARVDILSEGRIEVEATILIRALGRQRTAILTGVAVPTYAAGQFHLSDIVFEDIALVPTAGEPSLIGRAIVGLGVEDATLDRFEGYALDAGSRVANAAFARVPIYRTPDDAKGFLIDLALQGMTTEDGAVVVTLDALSAVGRIVGWIAVVVLSAFLGLGTLLGATRSRSGVGTAAGLLLG